MKSGEVNAVLNDVVQAIARAEQLTQETGQRHEVRIEVTIFEITDDGNDNQQQRGERGGAG